VDAYLWELNSQTARRSPVSGIAEIAPGSQTLSARSPLTPSIGTSPDLIGAGAAGIDVEHVVQCFDGGLWEWVEMTTLKPEAAGLRASPGGCEEHRS
jgi:hypothetical protein